MVLILHALLGHKDTVPQSTIHHTYIRGLRGMRNFPPPQKLKYLPLKTPFPHRAAGQLASSRLNG